MIIAMCGQKGGSGKTTAAVAAAVEWRVRGKRVLLVDLDPQGSIRTWGDVAVETGAAAIPTVVSMGAGLHKLLPRLSDAHDITVLDCPPLDSGLQRAALMVADLAVLPCGPSTFDVWALDGSVKLLREAQACRPELRAVILITRTIPRTTIGRGTRAALASLEVPVMAIELTQRITYQEFAAAGMGPTTYAPKSPAADEVRALASELERLGAPASRVTRRARGR